MKSAKEHYSKIKKKYLNFLKKQEVKGEPFYNKIIQLIKFYIPICDSIHSDYISKKECVTVGLSGGQGAGKTTIASILKIILETKYNFNVVSFSIDDFYKTLKQRQNMAKITHKLFLTRGVPGTHDTKLLYKFFKNLRRKKFNPISIPQFDKSLDNKKKKNKWLKIKKKPDIIIFEGWCIGAKHQTNKILKKTMNKLEKLKDNNLTWRKKVNNELKNDYKKIFKNIDKLIFLQIPHFDYVYKWRLLQEKKLKYKSVKAKIMNTNEIKKFIMFYERITKQMIKDLKYSADIVIKLDKKHRLNNMRFN